MKRRTVCLLLALVLAPPLAAFGLVASETGSRWLVGFASRIAGDGVSFEYRSGTLISPLELSRLEVRQEKQFLKIKHLSLRWRPSQLLKGIAHVEHLALDGVSLESESADAPSPGPKADFSGVHVPIAVRADVIEVTDLHLVLDASRNRVDSLRIENLRVDNNALEFSDFELEAPNMRFASRARMEIASPHAIAAGFQWSYRYSNNVTLRGTGDLSGELQDLEVSHRVEAPFFATLRGRISPLSTPLKFHLRADWRDLRWPLEGAEQVHSESGSFIADGTPESLRLSLTALVKGPGLPLDRVNINIDGGYAGKMATAALRWTVGLVDGGQASGQGTISGDAARLSLEHELIEPARLSTRGEIAFANDNVVLALDGEWQELQWPLTGDADFNSASGRYRLNGPLDRLAFAIDGAVRAEAAKIHHADVVLNGSASTQAPFPFDAVLDWRGRIGADVDAAGRGKVSGNSHRIEFEKSVERPFSLEIGGNIVLDAEVPTVTAEGRWRDLQWPPYGAFDYASKQAKFSVDGPLDALKVNFDGDLGGAGLPTARTRLDALVSQTGAAIRSLRIDTLGGDIQATGDLAWVPHPNWRLQVQAAHLNPESYAAEWPGDVSARASVSGELAADTPRIFVALDQLTGQLRGYAINGSGSIESFGSRVTARDLALSSGENSLRIDGEASDQLDLKFVVDAPALEGLAPQLSGRLNGRGALSGSRALPRVSANLEGADIVWKSGRIRSLSLNLDAGTDPGSRSTLALDARGLRVDESPIEQVTVTGSGTPETHRLEVAALADAGTLTATAKGSLSEQVWTGSVDANVSTRYFGDWRFEHPARIHAERDRVSIQRTCVVQQPASVCANGDWRAADKSVNARGEVRALPITLFKPFFPEGVRVDGPLTGDFSLGGSVDALEAEARILAANGTFAFEPGANFPSTEFGFNDATLQAQHRPSGTRLELGVSMKDAGGLRGSLDVGPFERNNPAPLRGRLDARFTDLSWLGAVLPQATEIRGELAAGVDIGGNTARPSAAGEIVLKNARANVPDLGLELSDISLNFRSQSASRYVVEGGLTSGGGRIEVRGESEFVSADEFRVDMSLKGQDFEIARLPTAHAYVSPDLRLLGDSSVADLSGRFHVPKATIKLKQLPDSAVAVSDDEIIVGVDDPDPNKKVWPGPRTRVMVDLTLGEEVFFEGFGLHTAIDGNVTVSGETGQSPNAQGVVSLRDGRYDAFGQKLEIQRGRLLFTGPIDNPGIDVTAVRQINDVTAGIAIFGNVKSIQSRVFSDPALPEAEAFSYLLTGRPLSGGSKSDAAMLSGAALSLGLQRSQLITRQIGATLGLDELSVGGEDVEQSSLLLGKQLTPNLFVRYALGLFQQSGKLLLNYRLTDSISLEAESGAQQGLDVIYQIERDKLF